MTADAPTGQPLPMIFVGHGSPMNTLEFNRWTEAWRNTAESFPKPRAILAVSAHWYINATAVTQADQPRTIHDFSGFPPELFAVEYPAPGDTDLVERVAALAHPVPVLGDGGSWGLDHGTWSVLVHMYPDADVPVVQLGIDATKPPSFHLDLGKSLEPLRHEGVLIFGSGNTVHNLGRMDWNMPDSGTDWAVSFDDAATSIMTDDPGRVTELVDHDAYALAAPTPDHLLPLFYVAGAASAAGLPASVITDGCAMGSLSMTSYRAG
jgi:4,5-DOPA dioxygenase extradiol